MLKGCGELTLTWIVCWQGWRHRLQSYGRRDHHDGVCRWCRGEQVGRGDGLRGVNEGFRRKGVAWFVGMKECFFLL